MVYGDEILERGFTRVRHDILTIPRNEATLKQAVADMREKMRKHLAGKKAGRFMLKQDSGGITDIEFLAQYLVLRIVIQNHNLHGGQIMCVFLNHWHSKRY